MRLGWARKRRLKKSRRPGQAKRKAGTHMWTAPVPQEFFGSDRIACIHMSGLLMRSQWIAGQDGFRDASSKQPRDLLRPMGPTDCLAPRIDRSYHLLLS